MLLSSCSVLCNDRNGAAAVPDFRSDYWSLAFCAHSWEELQKLWYLRPIASRLTNGTPTIEDYQGVKRKETINRNTSVHMADYERRHNGPPRGGGRKRRYRGQLLS